MERFTQEDKPKPDKNKGNWSKTSSKSGTTTFKPNQEEASKSGQVKQTKAKNKRGSKTNGRTFKSQYDIPKNNKGYTKSNLELGKKVHKEYKAGDVDNITRFKEYVLPSGKRVDYIDFETKTIYELKPHNPNQIRNGKKQLQSYLKEIESVFGDDWTSVLDTY